MNERDHNFIVVELGDNDFGNSIKKALEEGMDWWGLDTNACPIVWKRFIIAHLISESIKRDIVRGNKTDLKHLDFLRDDYFENRMRVKFEKERPIDDFDGGAAAYDLNLKYAWTY